MALVGTASPPLGVAAQPPVAQPPARPRVAAPPCAVQTTRLRYSLGDFVLGARPLRLLVDQQPFHERLPLDSGWFEPAEVDPGLDGTLVRGQPISADLPRFLFGPQFFRYVPRQYDRCTVDLARSWDEYLAHFTPKTRSTLRRKVRRFEEAAYGLDLRTYRDPADLDEFFAAGLFVSRRTYQARRLDCGLPESDAFQVEARRLAAQDRLRAYLLFAHGEPAAYLYCPIRDGVVEYAYVGHDPQLAFFSPGTVLLFLALERLINERQHRLFDFTEGGGPHKQLFGTQVTRCADVYTLRRRRSLVAAARVQALLADISRTAGAALEAIGAKRWLRRRLRGAEC